jgi:hypothetical protein
MVSYTVWMTRLGKGLMDIRNGGWTVNYTVQTVRLGKRLMDLNSGGWMGYR